MAKIVPLLASSLLVYLLLAPTTPLEAAEVKWSRLSLPADGRGGDWVLAEGSDVEHLTLTPDGTLYCYADPNGTSRTLFRSRDEGQEWEYTQYDGVITALAAPDADTIYLSDGADVYKSEDAGEEWENLGSPAGIADITCLDVVSSAGDTYIFIGTANGGGGDVYYMRDAPFGGGWTDLGIGNYDVYSVACSPQFQDDSRVTAIVTDNVRTYAAHNYCRAGDWDMVELKNSAGGAFAATDASNICFPDGFAQAEFCLAGVVGGDGGIYRIWEDTSHRLDIDTDIISLAIGDGDDPVIIGGEAGEAQVWVSQDDGEGWERAEKPPSGDGPTYVAIDEGSRDAQMVYAATSGGDSAFSISRDGGEHFAQTGLIDTEITTILDLGISPQDGSSTLFMLTWGGEHSLWRMDDDEEKWTRLFTSSMDDVDGLTMVDLSPLYGLDDEVLYLAGESNAQSAIWRSADGGRDIKLLNDPPCDIDAWAVADNDSLFITGFDGAHGLVYKTTNRGRYYEDAVEVGDQALNQIALSPCYDEDGMVMAGNTDGWVFLSQDGGDSFLPLPEDAATAPLTGSVSVCFDPEYSRNGLVYAASDTADEGIYRLDIDSDDEWENIAHPIDCSIQQLVAAASGALYAANSDADAGMERSLNPSSPLRPTFETMSRGLEDGAKLVDIWARQDTLWAIDSANTRLITFTDTLAQAAEPTAPPHQDPGVGIIIEGHISKVSLDWEAMSGATEYQWQINNDDDMSDIPADFEGLSESSGTGLPQLEPATTYHWRVRASEPVISPWSDKWCFTTAIGTSATGPHLVSPGAGSAAESVRPLFQWDGIAGAEAYELIVSTDPAFGNPTILKNGEYALTSTAWACNINLNRDTTYYWRVRAIGMDSRSEWSAVSVFTTTPRDTEGDALTGQPPPLPPQPSAETPAIAETASSMPDWMKYMLGALISAVVLLAVVVLVLVRGLRRP